MDHIMNNLRELSFRPLNRPPLAPISRPRTGRKIPPVDDVLDLNSNNESYTSGFKSPKTEHPTKYVCHICMVEGHQIKDCPLARPKAESFTPYQGPKRCFGKFECKRCNRTWMSGNSWANSYQQCKSCNFPVYPYAQASLDKPNGLDRSDQSKLHRQDLCKKCKELGTYCRTVKSTVSPAARNSPTYFLF